MSKKYTTNFLEDTNGSTGSANQVLVSTAAGIDWVDGSGSGIIGGPYLPLSAGSGFPLTGDLYINNATYIRNTDSNGTAPRTFGFNSSNNMYIGPIDPYAGGAVFYGVSANVASHTLHTGGSARMIINSSGNVGIGTTSPGEKLVVNSGNIHVNTPSTNSSGNGLRLNRPGSYYAGIEIATNGTIDWSIGANLYGFGIYENGLAATTRIIIKDGGNVGIGTTNPSATLHVKNTTGNYPFIVETPYDRVGKFISTDSGADLIIQDSNSTDNGNSISVSGDTMSFRTAGSSRVRILANGNVGIGTTSPSQKLEVNGAVLAGDYRGSTHVYLTSPDSWIFRSTGGNERMRVTSAGNVGIGTTSPGTKLYVDGGESTFNRGNSAGTIATFRGQNAVKAVIGTATSYFTGNVGIGTTSPGSGYAYDIKLDIVAPQLGGIPLRLIRDSSIVNYGAMIALAAKNSASEIITYGAITGGIVDSTDGSEDGFVSIRTIKNGTEAEKVRVDEDGNVGIGTTSPSQKLEVDGNVKAETLIATDLNDGYVPYSKSGTLGLQDSKIYTNGAHIGVGTTTLAAGCHITSLSDISATGYRVSAMQTAPSSRGDTGTLGEIRITADYIYVCYATDSWKRVAIAQW